MGCCLIELERLAAPHISESGELLYNLRLDGEFDIWMLVPEIS
jgi:hypothetical protein